jgi:hypothetical protein
MLDGCRVVRGRDNPNLEYAPWTMLPHLPYGVVGLLRHRMLLEGLKITPDVILRPGTAETVFVGSKIINLSFKDWIDQVGVTVTDTEENRSGGWYFFYGEDVASNNYFNLDISRSSDIDRNDALWVFTQIVKRYPKKNGVVRISLPTSTSSFSVFISLLQEINKNGVFRILPSLTPHNLEAYVVYYAGRPETFVQEMRKNITPMLQHMYHASIFINWARTVCSCLMIPGNVGKAIFVPSMYGFYEKMVLSRYCGTFFIDRTNKTEIYRPPSYGFNEPNDEKTNLPPAQPIESKDIAMTDLANLVVRVKRPRIDEPKEKGKLQVELAATGQPSHAGGDATMEIS